jgi:hypothetical protein
VLRRCKITRTSLERLRDWFPLRSSVTTCQPYVASRLLRIALRRAPSDDQTLIEQIAA